MHVLRQLLREFALPLLLALAWTAYNLAATPKEQWNIRSALNIFGPTFFFASWLVAQWFRVRKQQKVEAGLVGIEASLKQTISEIEHKTSDLAAYITGGESICYICGPDSESSNWSPMLLTHVGKHPMYDVMVRAVDIDIPVDLTRGRLSLDDLAKREWTRQFGDLVPGHAKVLRESIDLGSGTSRRFNLFFSARNGSFYQLLRCKRVDGIWKAALQVWKNDQMMFEHVASGYPLNELGHVEWEA